MTCQICDAFLSDYRSGDLTRDEHTAIEAHLAWCWRCVVSLRQLEATIRLAKGAFLHPDEIASGVIPESLVQAILAAARQVSHE